MARILVLDESAAMRRLLRFMLKGHEVLEARFGMEGLGAVGEGPLDLIICDISLPDMDAEEFFRGLLEAGYFGKLLILASHLDARPRDHFGTLLPVLRKPVDADRLLAKVAELLEEPSRPWDVK